MTRSLQAVYEGGVLRLLEPLPLPLEEHQQVTITVSDQKGEDWHDPSFLRYLETQADDSIDIDHVRSGLAKIPGSLVDDFRSERDERS